MASKRALAKIARQRKLGPDDERQLADKLYRSKVRVYIQTLRNLAERADRSDLPIKLSDSVRDSLRAEADRAAESMVEQFNEIVNHEVAMRKLLAVKQVEKDTDRTLASKRRRLGEQTAITSSYEVHADATLSFFRDAGIEPDFDFGGHPELGDQHPGC